MSAGIPDGRGGIPMVPISAKVYPDLVARVDAAVASGRAKSRSEAVALALLTWLGPHAAPEVAPIARELEQPRPAPIDYRNKVGKAGRLPPVTNRDRIR